MSTLTDTGEIRQELALLTSRVEAVEAQLSPNGSATPSPEGAAPPTLDLARIMSAVREITQELFPGKCEFTSEFDPEYPEDRYVVVNVEATGEIKEIAERGCAWDVRIRQLSEDLFGILRLSIEPR
jgi:hypothetical protein